MQEKTQDEKLNYEYSFVIAAVATIAAGKELQTLEDFIQLDGFGNDYRIRKCLKISNGAYQSWIERVFNFDKFRKTKCADIKEVKVQSEKIVERITSDVIIFKSTIANYMTDDDIIYENTLAEMVVINSLLHLAIKCCEAQMQDKELHDNLRRIFEIENPKQLYQNVKRIYDYLPCPDDFDVEGSEKVKLAMEILCTKIGNLYVEFFTEK